MSAALGESMNERITDLLLSDLVRDLTPLDALDVRERGSKSKLLLSALTELVERRAAEAPPERLATTTPRPEHVVRGAIAFARREWRNDGAEGETVHVLCDELEARLPTSSDHYPDIKTLSAKAGRVHIKSHPTPNGETPKGMHTTVGTYDANGNELLLKDVLAVHWSIGNRYATSRATVFFRAPEVDVVADVVDLDEPANPGSR